MILQQQLAFNLFIHFYFSRRSSFTQLSNTRYFTKEEEIGYFYATDNHDNDYNLEPNHIE